ncbi:MAG: hypothetical protein IIA50_03740, partial [Bacteroidetes bacterium]|nr:hypothetical protein [Bacteroidota bacterium]
MQPEDILASLSRSDKSVLSGGNRLLYAPSFPVFEDRPGLWDEAHFYNYPLGPLFTYAVLDAAESDPAGGAREIPLRFEARSWRPDALERRFSTPSGLTITERLALQPDDVIAAEVHFENPRTTPAELHLIMWTCQPVCGATEMAVCEGHLRFSRNLEYRDQPLYPIECALGANRTPDSWAVVNSQGRVLPPSWIVTPFYEYFNKDLVSDCAPIVENSNGVVYGGLHFRLSIDPASSDFIRFFFSVRPSDAPDFASAASGNPFLRATRNWYDFYDSVPSFECSDPFIQKYYNYRWFGLRMNMLAGGEDNYPHAAVFEGPAYFRVPISYSAQCHILETRWMRAPSVAQGSLLNFIHNQQADGRFMGYLAPRSLPCEFFYHTNWGCVRDLDLVHPEPRFLKRAYDSLTLYVEYFDRERDPGGSGLYEIHNHYETGQEYMHRYVAVDEGADRKHWGKVFRLIGIDVSVYLYEIKRALAEIAKVTGRRADAEHWRASARLTRTAIREKMWDPDEEMFFDINPNTGERTGVKAAVCFYPYFTDIVDESHLGGLKSHLFNPDEFWTPFPVPSSSVDDPYFDA